MARRRDRGEGSVYWNSHHGYWEGYTIVGTKSDGRPDRRYAKREHTPGVKGRKLVEEALRQLKKDVEAERKRTADAANPDNYTVWQAITDWHEWVPTTPRTSQYTADKYMIFCRKWVEPRIGHIRLVDLDLATLSNFMEDIAQHLGTSSLHDILGSIRRAIQYARREKKFSGHNVAMEAELPRAGKQPRDWDFLTKDKVEEILTQTEGTSVHALMATGFLLGLRPGEIRALKWEHIDFDRGVLSVLKWARKTGDGATKTKLSRRAIRMPKRLQVALEAHRADFNGHEYVFTNDKGDQLDKDALRWRVGKAFRAAGLDIEDPYVMRHTFASIADDEGVPHQKIADMMGHRDVTTFERIYRHRLRPEITETADLMDNIWGDVA